MSASQRSREQACSSLVDSHALHHSWVLERHHAPHDYSIRHRVSLRWLYKARIWFPCYPLPLLQQVFRECECRYIIFSLHIWHCQQGTDAPEGVHPDHIKRIDVERGNYGQRIPRPSAEIKNDTEEYRNLCRLIQVIMKFLRANVSLIYCADK